MGIRVIHSKEIVRIIKQFEDFADPTGAYMSHCHILEHEDIGMMTHWVVIDQATNIKAVEQIPVSNDFSVYPNPSDGNIKLLLNIKSEVAYTINLYNQNGQLIQVLVNNKFSAAGEHSFSFNLKDIPKGLYYCQFLSDKQVLTKKFIVFE